MSAALVGLGLLLLVSGLGVVAMPAPFRRVLTWFLGEGRYGLAVLGRLAVGVLLLLGAAESRWPAAAIALGALFLAAAAAVPLFGEERIGRIIRWWLARPPALLRGWGAAVALLGGFIAWLGS